MSVEKNLIISSYFFKKFLNPAKQIYLPKNDFNVIKKLFHSTKRVCKELYANDQKTFHVKIFHDGLSPDFTKTYSTKNFKFVPVDTTDLPYGPVDVLLIKAREFLLANPEYTNVFILNPLLVKIINNPFIIFKQSDYDNQLLIATVPGTLAEQSKLLENSWFMKKLETSKKTIDFDRELLLGRPTLTPDILGGKSKKVIDFLDKVIPYLEELHKIYKSSKGRNREDYSIKHVFVAVNYYSFYENEIFTGFPLYVSEKRRIMTPSLIENNSLIFSYN